MIDLSVCDKCGKVVAEGEDSVRVEMYRDPQVYLVFSQSRHITCSLSRAQFIMHPDFPMVYDDRPEFDKRLMDEDERYYWEAQYTAAWDAVQIRAMSTQAARQDSRRYDVNGKGVAAGLLILATAAYAVYTARFMDDIVASLGQCVSFVALILAVSAALIWVARKLA